MWPLIPSLSVAEKQQGRALKLEGKMLRKPGAGCLEMVFLIAAWHFPVTAVKLVFCNLEWCKNDWNIEMILKLIKLIIY